MEAASGHTAAPAVRDLLADGILAGDWVLDPGRSSIRLRTSVFGLIPVKGVFRRASGVGAISADGRTSGTLTVAAASIDTGNGRRDRHLRSADFLDADRYPDIIFTLDGSRPAGDGVAVTGALTVHGVTEPLSFEVVASVQGEDGICLDAGVRVSRAAFGLGWNRMGMVPAHSTVFVHTVFTRWLRITRGRHSQLARR